MTDRPNVLFILSDQHRQCSMPGADGCEVIAPNMERLQSEGTAFSNCYSNFPLCSPARAMLLSGRWPSDTGVFSNLSELEPSRNSLGHVFARGGYQTFFIGKWHLHAGPQETIDGNDRFIPAGPGRHGFEKMSVWTETNRHWDSVRYDERNGEAVSTRGYNATLMTDEALTFLGQRDRRRPFFLFLSLNPPHPPLDDAPPEFLGLYESGTLSIRENVHEALSTGEQLVPAGAHRNHVKMTLQEQYGQYYAHISAVDAEIGRLLAALEAEGSLTKTLVVYCSDHGDMLGSHGRLRKGVFYRESAQVPLVLSWPGRIAKGEESEMLVGLIDIFPTLAGLCDLEAPDGVRGTDLSKGILSGDGTGARYVLHFNTRQDDPEFRKGSRGLRTWRHLYITDGNEDQLFDTLNDPWEMRDQAAEDAYADLKAMLADCLCRALPPAMALREAGWPGA
ncbi:MAG: sulfatase [Caldilineaceae bacterium]|nr:sulfatase [Caldilineaceae bacterium]